MSNNHNELYAKLRTLPKVELHRHLEGSLRLSTLSDIARSHPLDLPGYRIEDFRHLVQITPDDPPDAAVFLSKFGPLRQFYQSPEIIDRVTYESIEDAAADNIVYMELRFTPIALAREKGFPLSDVFDWVIAAVQRAIRDFDIDVRLLVSMNRHEPVEWGEQFLELAVEHMNQGVVGMDLAGDEVAYPPTPFAHIFHKAREAGLNVTIHAGEWAGPGSVRAAIEELGATRLGHGVRIVQDSELVQTARDQRIALEVCPTSNLQSGVVPELSQHPLRDLYQLGLYTTINTDDPSISHIVLTDELAIVVEHLGMGLDDVKRHILNAAEAAFLPDGERSALVKRLKLDLYPETEPANTSS